MKIKAIVWDYDGTLVDTRLKNLNVTKAIISEVFSNENKKFSVLSSLENYESANIKHANWRELYQKEFEMNNEQIDFAGSLWTKYQLLDKTPAELFNGISSVISKLDSYKQGIVSQNSYENIKNNLERLGLIKYFKTIIGYEEIGITNQKPHPDGLLLCINELTDLYEDNSVIYIGDHETDVKCAFNANEVLGRNVVITIYINHTNEDLSFDWVFKPDYTASSPSEIIEIVDRIKNE